MAKLFGLKTSLVQDSVGFAIHGCEDKSVISWGVIVVNKGRVV